MATSATRRGSAQSVPKPEPPSFAQLLEDAVNKPGVVSQAYFHFHSYSFSNQLIALFECMRRGIEPGPIHTFKGWLRLNRAVRRGEKAITLCMPVSWVEHVDPRKYLQPGENPENHQQVVIRRRFVFRPNWFVLSQTDGEAIPPVIIPTWNEAIAMHTLAIEKVPFKMMNGNVQGYAEGRQVAVSPIAHLPHRTLFHEVGHVVLGHTADSIGMVDRDEHTPRDVREVEAEAVAYIVTQSLGMLGEEFSRGYLQHWLHGQKIEERSAQRIFHAADTILKAGRPKPPSDPESSDSPA